MVLSFVHISPPRLSPPTSLPLSTSTTPRPVIQDGSYPPRWTHSKFATYLECLVQCLFHFSLTFHIHSSQHSEAGSGGDPSSIFDQDIQYTCDKKVNDGYPWVTDLSYSLLVNGQRVATLEASLVLRDEMPKSENFWTCMREEYDTYTLAECLFDKYGNLRKKFYQSEGAKGSGVWGPVLDFANILLIKELRVDPNWRHCGLGTSLAEHALKQAGRSTYRQQCFSYVQPGSLEGGPGSFDEQITIAEKFWRSMGFRRIGTSDWFAYSDQADHPSRFLAAEDDFKRIGAVSQQSVPNIAKEAFRILANKEVPDSESLAYLQGAFPHDTSDPTWTSTSPQRDSILHIAARNFKPESVKYILAKVPDLGSFRNNLGLTPLEALEFAMESVREPFFETAFKVEGHQSTGFTHEMIACVEVLTGREVVEVVW